LAQTTETVTKARNKTHPSRKRKADKREEASKPEGVFTRKLRDWAVKERIKAKNQIKCNREGRMHKAVTTSLTPRRSNSIHLL